MLLPTFCLRAFLAAAIALITGGSSSMSASALELTVATCSDLATLPTSSMYENVVLLLDAAHFICDEATTVTIDGPHEFRVSSDNHIIEFTNVRFEVSGGADFVLEIPTSREFSSSAMFNGVTDLASNGSVFNVENGSSAVFLVSTYFNDNSVSATYSGGAVYAGGKVVFKYPTFFERNRVLGGEDNSLNGGGALFVASGGGALFDESSYFRNNEAGSGGHGGAVANFGHLIFDSWYALAIFNNNTAAEYTSETGDVIGGYGGAVFTGPCAVTSIRGWQSASSNNAARGGALCNLGTTNILRAGQIPTEFNSNGANEFGGHIYTSGYAYIAGDVLFDAGHSRGDGGAVYIADGGELIMGGQVTYYENAADGECDDVYASGEDPVCQSSNLAGLVQPVQPQ